MEKSAFEAAIVSAVLANPKNGAKWKSLETLFGDEGVRGSGALNNEIADRRSRIRQLLTAREHPGFPTDDYSRHCVLVLGRASAAKLAAEKDYLTKYVVPDILAERPPLPAVKCMETVLIVEASNQTSPKPVALLQWGPSSIGDRYLEWYPTLQRIEYSSPGSTVPGTVLTGPAATIEDGAELASPHLGRNVIFFGPPGSGKSHLVESELGDSAGFVRCVFHPDFAYSDFVGTYKPVTGGDPNVTILASDNKTAIPKPIVYYAFEPGPLIQAVEYALARPDDHCALIIEEINRGDCAAIFGDFFQLLDRAPNGASRYGIRVASHVGAYLVSRGLLETADSEVFLPANLSLFATMNTSDQSLFPMDSAFKRRWDWQSVPTVYDLPELNDVILGGEQAPHIKWLDFLKKLNETIVDANLTGDKRIGAWYVRAEGGTIPATAISQKLLFYLWHDVFRDRKELVFATGCTTFDEVQALHAAKGIRAACEPLFVGWS